MHCLLCQCLVSTMMTISKKIPVKKKSGGGRGLTADSISAPWQSEPSAVCKVFKSKMFSNLVLTFSSMDPTVVGHITTTADDHKV